MNKADLISAVAAEAGLSKVDAKKAVEAFVSTVTKALQSFSRMENGQLHFRWYGT